MKQDTPASSPDFSAPMPPEGIGAQQLPKGGAQRFKRGHVRADGAVFFRYLRGTAWWVSQSRFEALTRAEFARLQRWHEAHPKRQKELSESYYAKNKNACVARAKRWAAQNPEKISLIRRRRYHKIQTTPTLRTARNLRTRLRMSYLHRYTSGRAREKAAVSFLLWLAPQIEAAGPLHIDHLWPVSSFEPREAAFVNAPENVRWLSAKANLKKAAKSPTQEEFFQHLMLVLLWKLQKKI